MLEELFRRPLLLFFVSLVLLSISTWLGVAVLTRLKQEVAELQDDVRLIEGATLTLLALIIGFSFSMAVSRYDLRKNLEEAEANAIGTEWIRAELLPAQDTAKIKALLVKYTALRIERYSCHGDSERPDLYPETLKVQEQLWAAVRGPALAKPDPLSALAVSGMNDVINSQGYSQAARYNTIPVAAWAMMLVIAFGATLLAGVGAKSTKSLSRVLLILPLVLSVAFFLIADLDSTRRGLICVTPQNLNILSTQLR